MSNDQLSLLHNTFRKVISEYNEVYEKVSREGDWKNPFRDIISKDLPALITECASVTNPYKVVGSYGKGRWTAVPWIAVFDTRITTSAQQGAYIVYLLNKDTKTLYLSFGVAATEELNVKTDASGKKVFSGIVGSNSPQMKDALKEKVRDVNSACSVT